MSNQFNEPVSLSTILSSQGIKSSISEDIDILSISDSCQAESNSVCDYLKGPLPEKKEGLILFVKEYLEGYSCVVVENPQGLIIEVIRYIQSTVGFKQKYANSKVHRTVTLGKNVVIEENVEIGEGTIIEHNSVIHSGTKIGKNCLIRTHSSVGGDGYGYVNINGDLVKQPHLGGVVIGDNSEIGANTCIVKGIVNDTFIGNNVKIDNLVHVAHDCFIDDAALVIASSELSGYVKVGKRARIAPGACVKQRLSIGDGAIVGLGAVVLQNVSNNMVVVGNPAKPLKYESSK